MLQSQKSFWIRISGHTLRQFSVQFQQFRLKSGRPHHKKRYDDDGETDLGIQKRKETKDGNRLQLFKSRGQHLLTNQKVLDSIVRNSGVGPNDTVLEIGPGTGNLTMKLLEVAKKVVAVEVDRRMVEVLSSRVSENGFGEKLKVICEDALKADFPDFDLVVANIPYGISSPLVAKLVFGGYKFQSATLLLQKEFASRLLANPGDSDFNRLAVNVKLVAEVEHVMNVGKREFVPCPKVDSSVVKIRMKHEVPDLDLNEWWAFTKTCFGKKNKTLGATFKQKKKVMELLSASKLTVPDEDIVQYKTCDPNDGGDDEADEWECLVTGGCSFKEKLMMILRSAGLENKRPSKLSHEELIHLLSLFNQSGIRFHDQAKPMDINAIFAAS